jgi:hypothetical protein
MEALGNMITVPGSTTLYAAQFTVTRISTGTVISNYTVFGTQPVLVPPQGLDSLTVACGSGTGLA